MSLQEEWEDLKLEELEDEEEAETDYDPPDQDPDSGPFDIYG